MPILGERDVLVRTIAAAVNRADLFIRSGEWPIRGAFPYVPGLEVCGVVEQVGAAVSDFAEGDRGARAAPAVRCNGKVRS